MHFKKYDFNENNKNKDDKLAFLDQNHTHFILVKNQTEENKFGGEIEFRSKLEKELSKQSYSKFKKKLIKNIVEELTYLLSYFNCFEWRSEHY